MRNVAFRARSRDIARMAGLSADAVIRHLGLQPLPVEGGYFRETFRSAFSTAIYYLLTPDTVSLFHRLRGDEVYHFYLGDPVELFVLGEIGRRLVLGSDVFSGMHVQIVVPGGAWQGLRLVNGGRFGLMGTTMAPGFDPRDFELGAREALLEGYRDFADVIAALTPPSA